MNSTLLRFLAVILALGAIATAAIGYRLSTKQTPVMVQAPPPSYPRVVAAHDIPAGHLLNGEDVRLDSSPQRNAHGYATAEDVVGKLALEPIAAGTPLLPRHFPRLGQVAQTLKPGERGVAIKVNEVIGVGGFISPGDRVDVLLYIRGDDETGDITSAQIVLHDVRVLAFGDDTGETDTQPSTFKKMTAEGDGKPVDKAESNKKQDVQKGKSSRSAILAVPEKDAARLMLADSSGQVRLALRGAEPPAAAQTAEGSAHYLRLADMAAPGGSQVAPAKTVQTAAIKKTRAKVISAKKPAEEKQTRVIVHQGDKVELVSVRN
jgi:pilus assembly protein CpaB